MLNLTRRGLIVLGGTGAAGAVLAACGTEEERRVEGDDGALLTTAYEAESSLTAAYTGGGELDGDAASALAEFEEASTRRAEELRMLAADAGAEPSDGEAPSAAGLAGPIEAANGAVAAYGEAAGLLSSEDDRAVALRFIVGVAAELAALHALDGTDPAPEPFVTGGSEPPFVAPPETESEDDE